MFILNEKRINIYAPFTTSEGVTYSNLTDPEVRERLGVVEIADPTQPDDYSDDLYYRTEQDEAPYVVYTRKSDEQIAQQKANKDSQESLIYLSSTDWYVTRKMETGKEIPVEILEKREEARTKVL